MTDSSREEVLAGLNKWLHITDEEAVDVLMATALANYLPGDPLWLFYVGPPGSGKTEILRNIKGPHVYTVSNITPSSLISGFNTSDPEKRKRLDLMATLDKKLLIIKDFTSILSLKPDDASKVFADLREAYDGYLEKHYGSGTGTISYKARFGLIAATTSAIDSARKANQHLGERFLRVNARYTMEDRLAITTRAIENQGGEEEEREQLGVMVGSYITHAATWVTNDIEVSDEFKSRIVYLADVISMLRSEVQRDRNRVILYQPEAEMGARLVKQFLKLGKALANWRGHTAIEEADYLTVQRVAIDCVERRRWQVMQFLYATDENMPTKTIGDALSMPATTVLEMCEDLWVLKVLDRDTSQANLGGGYRWKIAPEIRFRMSSYWGVTIYPVTSLSLIRGGRDGDGGHIVTRQQADTEGDISDGTL